jgi:hypothetical protein
MSYLIAVVMLVTVGGALIQVLVRPGPLVMRLVALALCGWPIVTARVRTFPNAARLGTRADSVEVQSALARSICRDHLAFSSLDGGLRGDPAPPALGRARTGPDELRRSRLPR